MSTQHLNEHEQCALQELILEGKRNFFSQCEKVMLSEELELTSKIFYSSDEEESFGDQYHPLLNHLILEKIFEHLRGQDLKACRAVCRKWNESSIPFIRPKYLITLDTFNIENFVELCRENKMGIPFGRFDLRLLTTRYVIYQEFLSLCADTIKEISLTASHEVFVEDVSEILRSSPNLESFSIPGILGSHSGNIVKLFQEEDIKPKLNSLKRLRLHFNPKKPIICPTFVEEIITVAENICDLRVEGNTTWTDEDGNTHCAITEMLSLIEKLGRESSIKTLCLTGVTSQHIELLTISRMSQNGLRLEKFGIGRANKIDVFLSINIFKDSLKSLDIMTGKRFLDLPNMPLVTELTFRIRKNFNSRGLNLKNIFPVLETIKLIYISRRTTNPAKQFDEFFPDSEPCPTIKYLKLIDLPLKVNAFDSLRRVFPHLTKLKLKFKFTTRDVYGVEILRNLWRQMTELKVLSLTGEVGTNEDLDSIFTGIPTHLIQGLRDTQEITDLEKMTVECRRDTIEKMRNELCQFPSITNLTNLRSLHIDVTRISNAGKERLKILTAPGASSDLHSRLIHVTLSECGTGLRLLNASESGACSLGNGLTDVSGYLALYPMKHLCHLNVQNCEFTKGCRENLNADMDLESSEFLTLNKDQSASLLKGRTFILNHL